jgi:hypothetical protein
MFSIAKRSQALPDYGMREKGLLVRDGEQGM